MVCDRKGWRVANFSRVELEPEIVEDDSFIVNPEAFREALEKLMKGGKNGPITSRNVIVSLPEEKTFSHQVSFPVDSPQEEEDILKTAKNYIPIELGDAVVDYKKLDGVSEDRHITYSVVAAQKNLVESLIENLGEAGLSVLAVDVSKDSLFRCCHSVSKKDQKTSTSQDIMVVSVERDATFFNVRMATGETFTINSPIGGQKLVERIKKGLGISTHSEARQVLGESEKPTAKKFGEIKDCLQAELGQLAQKALELKHIVESQTLLKLSQIHVVGTYPCIPGLSDDIQAVFPETEVALGISGIGVPEQSCDFAKAIGLALRAIIPLAHETGVNLLPRSRKEELDFAEWRPKILRSLLAATVVLMGLAGLSGYSMGSGYLGVKTANQELKVSRDRIENPYLNKLAQASQQKSRLEGEMLTILKDSLPLSRLMSKIDGYNVDGVGLVNVTFYLDSAKALVLRLRGKSATRELTEQFVTNLGKEPYFSNVISPLSNLVGKGERFINIDMNVEAGPIMADYEKSQPQEAPAAKDDSAVAAPAAPETSTSVAPDSPAPAVPAPSAGGAEVSKPGGAILKNDTPPESVWAVEPPKSNP
jgi:type IV pilus assembly protein PilM